MNCKFLFETEVEAAEFPEHFRLDYRTWPCLNGCGGMRNEHLSQLQKCVYLPGFGKKKKGRLWISCLYALMMARDDFETSKSFMFLSLGLHVLGYMCQFFSNHNPSKFLP